MINATYGGQTYTDVDTLVASDGTNSAIVTLTESGSGIGEYTMYEYKDVQTSDQTLLSTTHTLGVVPKLVTVEALDSEDTTKLQTGIFSGYYGMVSHGEAVGNVWNCYYPKETIDTTVRTFQLDSTTFAARRYSAAELWDTAATYRIRFYA